MRVSAGQTDLKSGYTTGAHAAAALKEALLRLGGGEARTEASVRLPGGEEVTLSVEDSSLVSPGECGPAQAASRKSHNDDEDVTKGAVIRCILSPCEETLRSRMNPIAHAPHVLESGGVRLLLHAGTGVGVATLPGLKVRPGYPAINPGPLSMMRTVLEEIARTKPLPPEIHALFSVDEGERLAKQTANEKVGVMGGLSLLGTRGIVKPLSNEAYLQSIAAEVDVALENNTLLAFVLGNTARDHALKILALPATAVVETGNFIYDSLALLTGREPLELLFLAGPGKMARVALGMKNTHHKYGDTDMEALYRMISRDCAEEALPPAYPSPPTGREFSTIREMEEYWREISPAFAHRLLESLARFAARQLRDWIREKNGGRGVRYRNMRLRVILLDSSGDPVEVSL